MNLLYLDDDEANGLRAFLRKTVDGKYPFIRRNRAL